MKVCFKGILIKMDIDFNLICWWLLQTLISFVASAAFSVIFHSPKQHIIPAGLTGGFGWLIYIVLSHFGLGVVTASFFATVGLSVVARMFSFRRKAPVTIFLITGIFPLVPGIGIYKTGYSLFMSDSASTAEFGLQTIETAIVMALGMGLVLTMPQVLFSFKRLKKNKLNEQAK